MLLLICKSIKNEVKLARDATVLMEANLKLSDNNLKP
jgi:hypothetical protein